ncbi:MAG TPA: hypothetical protein VMU68_05340 [Acidimicrobiales bacterium]|nr:hypothetical protein [Acidimicrobiales bacterium]
MSSTTGTVPSGWYPDPSGARQWRVWTGSEWSTMTRPYGDVAARSIAGDLPLIQALHRLVRYGVAGDFAGISILVSVLAHWPGTAHPVSQWFALAATNVAVALLLIGTAGFAFAARELEGHWTAWAFIPGVNLFAVNAVVTKRLGGQPLRRVGAEVILMVLFVVEFHAEAWLCVAPVIVAVGQSQWIATFIEQIVNSSSPSSPAAS